MWVVDNHTNIPGVYEPQKMLPLHSSGAFVVRQHQPSDSHNSVHGRRTARSEERAPPGPVSPSDPLRTPKFSEYSVCRLRRRHHIRRDDMRTVFLKGLEYSHVSKGLREHLGSGYKEKRDNRSVGSGGGVRSKRCFLP